MTLYQIIIAIATVAIAVANVISAIFVVKFVRQGLHEMHDMHRSLAILRADVLIKRRQRARVNMSVLPNETAAEYKARIEREDADLTDTPELISKNS